VTCDVRNDVSEECEQSSLGNTKRHDDDSKAGSAGKIEPGQ